MGGGYTRRVRGVGSVFVDRVLVEVPGRHMGGHLAGTYGIYDQSVQKQLLMADEWP
jgi:hypothetical protein